MISILKVEQVLHYRLVKTIALFCTLLLLKVVGRCNYCTMLEILRWTAARVHPLSSIIIIIVIFTISIIIINVILIIAFIIIASTATVIEMK